MAFAYKQLTEMTTIGSSASALYTNPSSTITYAKNLIIHNTSAADVNVRLYMVPDNGGAVGTAANGNQFFEKDLVENETITIEFPPPGIVMEDANDTIQAVAGTAGVITIMIAGATE